MDLATTANWTEDAQKRSDHAACARPSQKPCLHAFTQFPRMQIPRTQIHHILALLFSFLSSHAQSADSGHRLQSERCEQTHCDRAHTRNIGNRRAGILRRRSARRRSGSRRGSSAGASSGGPGGGRGHGSGDVSDGYACFGADGLHSRCELCGPS
jgi:uncharacterized membrane protein YgcG